MGNVNEAEPTKAVESALIFKGNGDCIYGELVRVVHHGPEGTVPEWGCHWHRSHEVDYSKVVSQGTRYSSWMPSYPDRCTAEDWQRCPYNLKAVE